MARACPARTIPGQLTLDDWAEMLSASSQAVETEGVKGVDQQPSRHHPAATELLEKPEALLTRSHLRELGLERRAVDAVFRAVPVVALPGYSRPLIRVRDYLELLADRTFRDDRVRPMAPVS